MIKLKSPDEIKVLKEGGKILSSILHTVASHVKPGITTSDLNQLAEDMIISAGGQPSFKNYGDSDNPYPAGLCTSVNHELVHGIPSDYILKEGDIISLDVGMLYPKDNGLYTDMAITVPVGKISKEAKNLMNATKNALQIWIKNIKSGRNIMEIATKVQKYIEKNGYGVVRDLVGHGVGHAVHEDPQIPNYNLPSLDFELKEGMVLALEPMVSLGDFQVTTEDDGWTVSSLDKSLTAHFEHTIVVTKHGCDIITK